MTAEAYEAPGWAEATAPASERGRREDVFRPVWRERVMRRLDEAARYRIVGIVAPAGFGKSTVLRQYLQARAATYFNVPRAAPSLVPFVGAFADALAAVVPALPPAVAAGAADALAAADPALAFAQVVAHGMVLADRELVVAVDDLHAGDADPAIARFVAALVAATPRVRWFIASRTPAGLPFASWIAYGQADFTIDADDLRLTADEARACTQTVRAQIDDVRLAQLCELVDGWPAAFQFAVRSLLRSPAADGTRELVSRYLAEQVWCALDPELRTFLRTAAFLPTLRLEHCFAAGFPDACKLVEELRQRTAFVRRAGDGGEYVLRGLFREFVQEQVLREGDAAARGAWQAAASALESAGAVGDALDCYVRARGGAEIRAALRAHGNGLIEAGELDALERALAALDRAAGGDDAALDALRGLVASAGGRREEADYYLHRALGALGALDDDAAVEFGALVATHYARCAKLDALPALDALDARPGLGPVARALLASVRAATIAPHDAERAVTLARGALATVESPSVPALTRMVVYERAAAAFDAAGEGVDAGRYAAGAATAARAAGRYVLAGAAALIARQSAAAQGRREAAVRAGRDALDAARRCGDVALEGRIVRALLGCAVARGAQGEVDALCAEALGATPHGRARLGAQAEALGMASAWSDRFDDARDVLHSIAEDELSDLHNCTRYALLAAVCVAGEAPLALGRTALERYARFAAADRGGGRAHEASRALAERWAALAELVLCGAVKARRSFARRRPLHGADAGVDQCVLALLNESHREFEAGLAMLRRADRGGHARFLESVCAGLWANRGDGDATDESLTACETQVLRALADGLSNRAIGEGFGRSVNTIKSQVAAILRKLGAGSRSEAVAAGRRRGLIG